MQGKLQNSIICLIFFLTFSSVYSQIDVEIQNMTYDTGEAINHCGIIDIEDNTSVNVNFTVDLQKDPDNVVGESTLRIYTKVDSYTYENLRDSQIIQEISWSPTSFLASFSITLDASEFNVDGGFLYAELETFSGSTYNSFCNYPIQKDEVPTFTLSPGSKAVSCGSSSPITFTVDNVYNSPGTLEYHWLVGGGWLSTSSFATTTNTVELVPYAYPPSDVKVTPVLDGETYPQLTSVISISSFNPSYSITGNGSFCSTATYSVNNLPNGVSVTSWNVSNTSIANISENGDQATLTATTNGNGAITVSANLVNSCGQMKTIEKDNIQVGRPDITVYGISGNSGDKPVNSTSSFHVTGVNNYNYTWDIEVLDRDCNNGSGPAPFGTTPKFVVNGGQFSPTATGSHVTVFWGNCSGRFKINCDAVNTCGSTGVGYKTVEVFDGLGGGDPCPEDELNTYPNPVTQGDVTVNIIDPEPCPLRPFTNNQSSTNSSNANEPAQSLVKIYDLSGIEKYTGTFTGNDDFTITGLNLPQGMYVIHVTNSKGFDKQEMLAVD